MQDSKGINSLKQARELLEKHAIKGEHLAYINKDEAKLLKYMGGAGIPVNSSGIPSYFVKKAFKKITKPFAKVLDKIVPNEIKPALPFIAAAVPFLAPALLPGLTAMQYAAISAGANAASQLSQEGAAKYGINPISLGLSALSGYGAAPGAGQELAGAKIVGSSPAGSISAGELAKLQGIDSASQLGYSTDLSFLDKAQNVALGLGESSANYLGKGTDVVNKLTGPAEITGSDLLTLGKTALPGQAMAVGDLAYNNAMKALDEYDQQQAALGAMGVANTEARKSAIRKAMGLAGYTDPEIETTLLKFKFATGGRVGYQMGGGTKPPAMPINPEMLALAIYGKRYDELTYTQKSAIADMLPNKKAEGGIMDLGGMEMDYRAKGGFVPIGEKEKADDVPARLSKNEFVFTADAVRGAGKGDIKKGAKKMYQLMKQYEAIA
jgi:hypothetical protein